MRRDSKTPSIAKMLCKISSTCSTSEIWNKKRILTMPSRSVLAYNGKSWCTVDLEVGHDEIGDADEPEYILSPDIAAMFEKIGLPAPAPIPLMPIPFQIAQKLHGATGPGSRRANDLVDLQLILAHGEPSWARTRDICVRLFNYRKQQAWPPTIAVGTDWESLYAEQSANVPVLPTVEEAVAWTQRLIGRIDAAR